MTARRARHSRAFWWLLCAALACAFVFYKMDSSAKPAGLVNKLDVRYTIIDMRGGVYRAVPAVAKGPDRREGFESMISRLKPYAAITGTYYDPDFKPLGDIVIAGKVVVRGGQRQGIGFTKDGKIVFRERTGKSPIDWRGCESGIACGPRLLRAGKKDINVTRDGFSKAAATKLATRCAVGATKDGKLVLCMVADLVTLNTLAQVMIDLGAVDAINLDGGPMCGLYVNGKYQAEPMMKMSNILAVYKKR